MSQVSNQINLQMLELNSRLLIDTLDTSAKIRQVQPQETEQVYAKEGDAKYKEEIDSDDDGAITYDEYMKYCEENAVSQYSENPGKTVAEKVEDKDTHIQSIRPINIGKALNTYFHSETTIPESKMENII